MRNRPAVALLIEMSNSYSRGLIRGIQGYMTDHGSWSIYFSEQSRGSTPPAWLSGWKGDGIIARIENEEIAEFVQKFDIPIVDVSAKRVIEEIPMVEADDNAIAKLAFDHFQDRGYQHLAFCGDLRFRWSEIRCNIFRELAEAKGLECHFFESSIGAQTDSHWLEDRNRMAQWVKDLPKPVGIFACYDIIARILLDICRSAEIAVPEEAAILGVDNDEVLCNLSYPPLSSIELDSYKIGYEAARTLDWMMQGNPPEKMTNLIKPTRVETRQSTDSLALEDTDVAAALQFIRLNACDGINVHDVLKTTTLSRRILESRFRKLVGRTPHEEILRVKIDHVKRLLTETQLDMSAIALRTGFRHVEYLSVAFKRTLGCPPSTYRNKYRNENLKQKTV